MLWSGEYLLGAQYGNLYRSINLPCGEEAAELLNTMSGSIDEIQCARYERCKMFPENAR